MKEKYLILLLMLILVTACEKELPPYPTKLPPATEEGKNTFGCMIEDELYVPEIRRPSYTVSIHNSYPIKLEFPQYPDYYLMIHTARAAGKKDDFKDADITLYASDINKPGIYKLSISSIYNNSCYTSYLIEDNLLIITKLDTVNYVISGQFNGMARDCHTYSRYISITQGRFDLKLEQQ
jgi:hypothetical protein